VHLKLVLMVLTLTSPAFARLGDTRDQAEVRYGLRHQPLPRIGGELVEGARELQFDYQGWRIRCALLLASNGKEYVAREEYRKIWHGEVMKNGGVIQIRDLERDAVLAGEAGPQFFWKVPNGTSSFLWDPGKGRNLG
jgi:hypothetical protein